MKITASVFRSVTFKNSSGFGMQLVDLLT